MGKYLLLERLATGGMAEVYRAKASGAGGFEKHLAIKKILANHVEDETFQHMFQTEARIGSSLQHANIVQILDFVKIGETFLLVMEFVNGKNLRQVINKLKKLNFALPLECALYVINETCKGLDYAHTKKDDYSGQSQNIIHRDMSPQNIMLSYEGSVKIVDFGIANWKDKLEQTKSGVIKGKFGYMSPEQAAGQGITNLTDVFSTGIIFWELLTGKRLFTAETDLATLRLIQDCVIPKPSQFNSKISPELERIIMKALSKNVAQRYQSAGAMQRQIQEYLNKHYPSFRGNELANMMQRLFKEELLTEKKRIELLSQQSVPFSQGDAEVPEVIPEVAGIEEPFDGSITSADQSNVSHVTFVDKERVPAGVVKLDDSNTETRETFSPEAKIEIESPTAEPEFKAPESISTLGKTFSHSKTQPEHLSAPETIAKTIAQSPVTPPAPVNTAVKTMTQSKPSKLQEVISQSVQPPSKNSNIDVESTRMADNIRLDTQISHNTEISRESWNSWSSHSQDVEQAQQDYNPNRSLPVSSVLKLTAASLLIGTTAYLYHMLLSGRSVIPVRVDTNDPRTTTSCDPTTNPKCSNRANKITESPLENAKTSPNGAAANCEVRFETDPPGALVVIDGVEKIPTPGTTLVPCDSPLNYSLQLPDYETVAENIFIKKNMRPISKLLKKIERGNLVIITNRRVKVYSDTDLLGETEAGKEFIIENLPANKSHRIRFINEIFGINESRTYQIKPGINNRIEERLDERPIKN